MKILLVNVDPASTGVITATLNQPEMVDNFEVLTADTNTMVSVLDQHAPFDLLFLNEDVMNESSSQALLSDYHILQSVFLVTPGDEHPVRFLSKLNCFSYVSKPLQKDDLKKVFDKYHSLKTHFMYKVNETLTPKRDISRIVGKRGYEYFNIRIEQVSYFYTENRIVYLVTRDNHKYITEYNSLTELYDLLDKSVFYRINRRQIVNLGSIKKFRSFEKLKIFIELDIETTDNLIVSQDNASYFRRWIRQAV